MSENKLVRPNDDRWIGGVCAGLGNYFGIDPTVIRILFVLFSIFVGGGIIVYLILWLVIPQEGGVADEDIVAKNITDDDESA